MNKALIIGVFAAWVSSTVMVQAAEDQKAAAPVAGKVLLGVDIATLDWVAVGYRASKLLKSDVYNDKNTKIGKVADLIIKPDGTVNLAIIEVGGFLGIDAHLVAIRVDQFTSVTPKIILPGATKESLKSMPEFKFAKSST